MNTEALEPVTCPSCGGAGGGPIGRAGGAWDDDDYVCPRCKGAGVVALDDVMVQRPGLVKASPGEADGEAARPSKRKASA